MLFGFCTRPAAILLLGQMVVAISLVHWQAGFLAPKGYEYPMTLGWHRAGADLLRRRSVLD